jgi:error-prone DNA polymerase
MRTLTCAALARTQDRARVRVAGLVVTRQRPGTASGVIFLTLEDETGIANVIVWPKTYERFRRAVIAGRLLRVTGQLQREGSVQHLVSWRVEDLSHMLDRLGMPDTTNPRADEARRPTADNRVTRQPPRARHPREQAKHLFPSRDFH